MTEPINQPTKDLIEKEAISYVIKETGYQILPEHDHWKKAYIAGATNSFKYLEKLLNEKLYKEVESLREQLAKLETQSHDQVRIIEHLEGQLKQERNKAIDECIKKTWELSGYYPNPVLADILKSHLESLKDKSHE